MASWHAPWPQYLYIDITLEDNVTSSAVSYYLDLARAGAMKSMQAEFISTPAAQPQMPRRPFLLISVDDMPAEEICFDTAVRYFDTQLRWHSGEAPGKVCPNECPCYDGRTDCMDIGSCYANSPHDSLFWVLVIQNPVEAILTSYHNHMACLEPEPHEQWMQEITAAEYARILKSRGVKPHILSHLKMTNADNTSAWQHLQQLPEHDGLLLEFLHMSTSLWKMARMHKQARRLNATSLVIKQEDLEEDPLPVLSRMAAVTGLADQNDMLLAQYVDQKCSPLKTRRHRKHHQGQKKSAPPGNKSHIHLPAAEMAMADEAAPNVQGPKEKRERRERRENLLMGHGDVFDALCRLEQLLGYTDKTNSACVRRRLLKDE